MLNFVKETITPAKAQRMLNESAEAGFLNRSITSSFVNRYSGDMEKGHWQSDTGETIKVTKNSVVIDGQHRLVSVIKADVPVKMWVCRDIEPAMFQYIDQGKSRDLADIMSIEGWENPRILSVTGKMLWRREHSEQNDPFCGTHGFNESEGNVFNWVSSLNPNLLKEWRSYGSVIRNIYSITGRKIPESLMFYLLYLWKQEDNDAALLFAGYLAEGALGSPPHPAMAFFKEYAFEIALLKAEGKLAATTGRQHDNIKELLLSAAEYSWQMVRNNKGVRTYKGFKTGLGKYRASNGLVEG